MQIRVDPAALDAAAAALARGGEELHALARTVDAAARDAVADPVLGAALTHLADAVTDVADVVALDLDVVATRVRAAAAGYRAAERAVAGTTSSPAP